MLVSDLLKPIVGKTLTQEDADKIIAIIDGKKKVVTTTYSKTVHRDGGIKQLRESPEFMALMKNVVNFSATITAATWGNISEVMDLEPRVEDGILKFRKSTKGNQDYGALSVNLGPNQFLCGFSRDCNFKQPDMITFCFVVAAIVEG